MAEGGYFPWRCQELRIAPHLSPKDYCKSLPTPPLGFYWLKRDDRTWDLERFNVDEKSSESKSVILTEPQLYHVVMAGDTLAGLSLRYRVPVSEIKRVNVLSNPNIQALKQIIIPITHGQPFVPQGLDEKDVILQRFRNETGESKEESLVYLEDNGYSLHAALAAWNADEAFERDNVKNLDALRSSATMVLTPEEQRLEAIHRHVPPFTIVQPTRIVFCDAPPEAAAVPSAPEYEHLLTSPYAAEAV